MAATDVGQIGTLSIEEFMALPDEDGYRLELANGRLVREPAPGPRHGQVAVRLLVTVWNFVDRNDLGLVFVDTAFTLASDDGIVRVPDVAFVSSGRVPADGLTDRFWVLAPDLAVEVVSPSNRMSEMQQKVTDYLDAGTRVVWIVDPSEHTVTTYRSRSKIRILEGEDVLDGEDVLPGLRIQVSELFDL